MCITRGASLAIVWAPAIDEESYIKRVSYRIKKWAGVEVVQPDYEGKPTKPHERAYCEGCKRGKCTEDEDFWSD